MKDVRIQKVLAEQGVCSRRAAEQIISEGRVKLNGRPVTLGDKMDTAKDLLTVDDQRVFVPRKTEKYYYMLHKPRGYITTASDERGRKTVMELMADAPARVYPIGRLDKDSEGLLLFTNDGDFANLLTHPSHGASKLYRVTVRPHATEEQIISLTDGVALEDGTKTLPAVIRVITDEPERTVLEMTIREGKNRQIRRMCEAVGLSVIRLRRTAVGAVKLGMLQPGEHRELTPSEITALRTAASRGKMTSEIARNTEQNARRRAEERPHGVRAPKGRVGAGNAGARTGQSGYTGAPGRQGKPNSAPAGRGPVGGGTELKFGGERPGRPDAKPGAGKFSASATPGARNFGTAAKPGAGKFGAASKPGAGKFGAPKAGDFSKTGGASGGKPEGRGGQSHSGPSGHGGPKAAGGKRGGGHK